MILGQYGVHTFVCPCVCVLKVDKAGLVHASVQLCGPHCVDEVLIRALTAGVRRSAGDTGFWLGLWEPDGAWGHVGRVAAARHGWFLSGQCTQHAAFVHGNTNTHMWLSTAHRHAEVCDYKAGRANCETKPGFTPQLSSLVALSLQHHHPGSSIAPFHSQSSVSLWERERDDQSAECVAVNERMKLSWGVSLSRLIFCQASESTDDSHGCRVFKGLFWQGKRDKCSCF